MSFANNLKMASIILSLNFIFYLAFFFGIFYLIKKNNIKLLKVLILFYYILLTLSFIFNNSIIIYLFVNLNKDYIFVPALNMLVNIYQLVNLLYFLKHKKNNPYITLSINISIIFFSLLNLFIFDEDEMFQNQSMYIITIYGIISSIIFNFLTVFIMFGKCYVDLLLHQNSLYLEINQIINEDCSICLEPLNNNVIKTKCNHYFHKGCILQSLVIKKDCPLCRQEVV
jgi:hypothetical protein